MSYFSDQAIILKRIDFDEAKRIITFLTCNYGKLSAVAPGVRKVTSRKGSHLELFNHSRIFLAKGKNLDIITEAETMNSFANIRSDLEKIGCAYYIAELVDALLPEKEKNYKVFNLTLTVLKELNLLPTLRVGMDRVGMDKMLREFEVNLLKVLGFWSDAVHGKNYPSDFAKQYNFNKILIEQIIERQLKTPKIFPNSFLEK